MRRSKRCTCAGAGRARRALLLRRPALLAVALVACTRSADAPPPASPVVPEASRTEHEPPRLVVVIVIDQLPSWSFDPQTTLFEGGLARLLDEGTYFPHAAFPYAVTLTAPGHAALGTGAPPARSGIMSNRWFDPQQGRAVEAVEDPDSPVFSVETAGAASHGISARSLLVEGVADELRRATAGRGRSVAVGLKDRAAVLMLGKRPDLAVWYDDAQLAMTTSRAYAERLPQWLATLAGDGFVPQRLDYTWEPLDPPRLAEITGRGDLDWGGGEAYGLGNTFPYSLSKSPDPGRALAATPLGNTIVLETARTAVTAESLGADDVPDLLGIAFSSHDYAGHLWGQESWERLDMLLRIDRELGDFFTFLDDHVGPGRWAAVLTSDHGATPLPEAIASGSANRSPNTVQHGDIRRAVETVFGERLGPGPWVTAIAASTVYLDPRFEEVPEQARQGALEAAVDAVRAVANIGHAASRGRAVGECGARVDIDALVCWSLRPDRSGEIYFTAAPGHYASDSDRPGTSHGSPSDHDRIVPVVVYAPGWPAGRHDEHVSALQVAPTVARLLGIDPPRAASAPALEPGPGDPEPR